MIYSKYNKKYSKLNRKKNIMALYLSLFACFSKYTNKNKIFTCLFSFISSISLRIANHNLFLDKYIYNI